jgi:Xaa-Pro aminopeptidase
MTRTVIVGKSTNDKAKNILKTVNEIFYTARSMVKPGVNWAELDKYVRKFYSERDVLQYYNHSLGHGVGIEGHESPWINYQQIEPEKKLEVGMVLTIEPGLYIPEIGGARTEDTVVVTESGFTSLCGSPIREY